MAGFNFLNTVTALVAVLAAAQVSAVPFQSEAGLHLAKRGSFSGDATYYDPGLGSCEVTSSASELIAALNAPQFGSYPRPSNSPACSSCALVQGPKGSVKVKIVDKCPSCKHGDLDLSPAAFDRIADQAQGRVTISWSYVSCGGGNSEAPAKDTATTGASNTESKDQASEDKNTTTSGNKESSDKDTVEKPKNDSTTSNSNSNSSSSNSNKVELTSDKCNFHRKCTSAGQNGEFETCVHGRIRKQTCASGTVCKSSGDDITCTWA